MDKKKEPREVKVIVVKHSKDDLKGLFNSKQENIVYLGNNEFLIPHKR